MSEIENPPAFPQALTVSPCGDVYSSNQLYPGSGGMTIRDWFAGQALAGLSANPHAWEEKLPEQWAVMAYELADFMLAERSKKESGE